MEATGYIKLYRKFLEWEWYDDTNCKIVFIHLLIKTNYRDKQWRGKTIKRGQFFTSIENLSDELHFTPQQIRTSLSKLESTGEIIKNATSEGTYITICNYDNYQALEQTNQQTDNKPVTSEQQTDNKPVTTTNNNKNNKEGKEIGEESYITQFEIFRQMYPGSKRGLEPEYENLKKMHKDWREIIPLLSDSLQYQIRARDELKQNGGFVPVWKNLKTWINQKCWTEEINTSNTDGTYKKPGVTDNELAELYANKFGSDSPERRY